MPDTFTFPFTPISGPAVEVTFNPATGYFAAEIAGKTVRANTTDDLASKIKAATRKAAVKVHVAFVHPNSGEQGVATGLHAITGRPLIRWASGSTEAVNISGPLSPSTDASALKALIDAAAEAQSALAAFRAANRIGGMYEYSLTGVVQTAIDKAAKAPAS